MLIKIAPILFSSIKNEYEKKQSTDQETDIHLSIEHNRRVLKKIKTTLKLCFLLFLFS